jgi:hypothetical protein
VAPLSAPQGELGPPLHGCHMMQRSVTVASHIVSCRLQTRISRFPCHQVTNRNSRRHVWEDWSRAFLRYDTDLIENEKCRGTNRHTDSQVIS